MIATPDENGYIVTIPENPNVSTRCADAADIIPTATAAKKRTNRTGMKKPPSVRNAERHIQVIRQCHGQTTKRKSGRNEKPVKRWTLPGLTKQNRTKPREAHKCCKIAGIKSKSKHYRYKKPRDPERVFPNLLSAELNIDGPLQCIVSDMTAFYVKGIYYELTLYMDLWNNEIVSHAQEPLRIMLRWNPLMDGLKQSSSRIFMLLERNR